MRDLIVSSSNDPFGARMNGQIQTNEALQWKDCFSPPTHEY